MVAIGLMSGTSRDGIDAAMIRTDGEGRTEPMGFYGVAYAADFRERLAAACLKAMAMETPGADPLIGAVERDLTALHADAVQGLLAQLGMAAEDVDIIGFHGHTVAHRPERGWTWQIGDWAGLASASRIDVVGDLRIDDVRAGGQGAPLLPVYHRALTAGLRHPLAVLNLGGVANITFVGSDETLIAFDTGMASGLIDNWMQAHGGVGFDEDGGTAARGKVDAAVLAGMLADPWFALPAPTSIDREAFSIAAAEGLGLTDGAATLTAFTAQAVARALDHLPERPERIMVAGGGRHNRTMMTMLAEACGCPVEPVDGMGWNGDAVEAEGFAYMAVRSLKGLPISFPGTTGAPAPMTGGTLHRARKG